MIRSFSKLLMLGVAAGAATAHAAPPLWTATPYRVLVQFECDGPLVSAPGVSGVLRRVVVDRLDARLVAYWRARVEPVDDVAPLLTTTGAPDIPSMPPIDKLFAVRVSGGGRLTVVAREYDATVGRWGSAVRRSAAEVVATPEAVVEAIAAAFRPIAAFDVEPDDPRQVRFTFRGAELGPPGLSTRPPGSVLLPFTRRLDRQGRPSPDGAQQVRWTYLVTRDDAEAPAAGDGAAPPTGSAEPGLRATVESHARLPFGARRRGRIEQIALPVLRRERTATRLRLVDQQDGETPLRGYEVLLSGALGKDLRPLGRTDARGEILVPPTEPIYMAHLRAGRSVVATLPIVAGAQPLVEVPLLNEVDRLEAETRISQLQEDLFDVSARRNLLMVRARESLEEGDADEAKAFIRRIERLPGRAQFTQRVARLEDRSRADHPVSQQRLDRLFTQTRDAIGEAFDPSALRDLEARVLSQGGG